jgi:FkbM family methyltransferase
MTDYMLNYQAGDQLVRFKMDLDLSFPADRWIIQADMHGSFYEPDIAATMFRCIKPGDTVVDVGANVGYFTCLMAALVGPMGRVFAFEPASGNLKKLSANVKLNDFSQVKIIPKAVGAESKQVQLYISADDSGGNALWNPALWWENKKSKEYGCDCESVEMTTLQAALGKHVPTFIKVDTEGAETEVLRDLKWEPRPVIIAELSHFALAQFGSSEQVLRALMRSSGYQTFLPYRTGDLPKLVPPGTRTDFSHNINLLFSTIEDVSNMWPEVRG